MRVCDNIWEIAQKNFGGGYRANNYDALRCYAMMMVVLNHVADVYLICHVPSFGVYIYEGISHCAVPCFLMLTGAFQIDKVYNKKPLDFYWKSFKKLGIPTLFFIALYWSYDYLNGYRNKKEIVDTFFKGFMGSYAHWYVVMLVGVYALLPVISVIKHNVDKKTWRKGCTVFFIWTLMSRWLDVAGTTWGTSTVINCLGYVLIGDVLKNINWKRNNLHGSALLILANIVFFINHTILFKVVESSGNYYNVFLSLYGAPLVAGA